MTLNILITGADGFLGSHLTEILVKKGPNVKALSYYNSLLKSEGIEIASMIKGLINPFYKP